MICLVGVFSALRVVLLESHPKPSILAAIASSGCCKSFICIAVVDGMLKPSCVSGMVLILFEMTTCDPVEPFHSGCGMRPVMFSRPVPTLAQPQIPRCDGVRCGGWTGPPSITPISSAA
jgi:hypothetical protein